MHRRIPIILGCIAGLWATSASADLTLEGPCVQGHRWTATMLNQGSGGMATYNRCTPGYDMLYMRCTPGTRGVEVTIEGAFTGLGTQPQLTAMVGVDGRAYPIQGSATFSEMTGTGTATFLLDRDDPLFDALQEGSRAEVILAGNSFAMHLAGTSDVVPAMFEACS